MKIPTPTGSKIHRVWKCPPSIVLPQIDDTEPHPAAGRGKEIHAFLEDVRKIGREAAIARAPAELRLLLELLNLDELPVNLATEVAFLYDWKARNAREIGRSIGRDYDGHLARTLQRPRGPNEIPLTIDIIGGQTLPDGRRRGYVGDYKSGRTKHPSPDKFGQTLLAALCVRHVYQADDVIAELIFIREDGTHYAARRTLDEWDLDTFADELESTMELVGHAATEYHAGRGVAVREGPHCDYCPAYKQCPAKIALVRSIPAELEALGVTGPVLRGELAPEAGTVAAGGAITRERAAELWMLTERIGDVLSRIREEITGLGAYGDIELPDGRVIGRLVTRREGLVGRVAASVIEQWFGAEAKEKHVEYKVSKEALREAVVEHVNRRKAEAERTGVAPTERLVIQSKKGDGILDRAIAEIRARGGIEESVTDSIRPHVPRRKALKG